MSTQNNQSVEIGSRSKVFQSKALRKKGYVLVTMAGAGFALMGAVGMAIDVGRLFATKTETQAYTDAAALAAALELDGTALGITNAKAAVVKANNTWNFNTKAMPTPTVEFGITALGPWLANPVTPAGVTYARVQTTVSAPLAFMPIVMTAGTRKFKQNVVSRSVAGQVPIGNFPRGLAPYTAVSTDPTGPRFGLIPGESYNLQWPQFNGSRAACNPGNPEQCFNSPPCSGDSRNSLNAVVDNWGSDNNGYWGFSDSRSIELAILDGIQTQPISVGMNIEPILTSGNMAIQGAVLDDRASQDDYNASNNVVSYLESTNHNGRRLLVVPVVNPESPTSTTVLGFAEFLLLSNGNSSNYYHHPGTTGNDPFCALYVGPYILNSDNSGGAVSGTGGYRVKLVE